MTLNLSTFSCFTLLLLRVALHLCRFNLDALKHANKSRRSITSTSGSMVRSSFHASSVVMTRGFCSSRFQISGDGRTSVYTHIWIDSYYTTERTWVRRQLFRTTSSTQTHFRFRVGWGSRFSSAYLSVPHWFRLFNCGRSVISTSLFHLKCCKWYNWNSIVTYFSQK